MEERLHKFMSRCGIASRRHSERLISHGLVSVNGVIVQEPGIKINPLDDEVRVENKLIKIEKLFYILHHKVKSVTTTVYDELGRRTVMDYIDNVKARVYPVGRLDKDSEGLLVFTNDGDLANYLTHPKFAIEKTYRVTLEGRIEPEILNSLKQNGIRLGPTLIKPTYIELLRYENQSSILLISVSEGVNREVRRIFAALGHEVKRLIRIRVGPLKLEGIKKGATRFMTSAEIKILKRGMSGKDINGSISNISIEPIKSHRKPQRNYSKAKKPRLGKPDPALFSNNKNSRKPTSSKFSSNVNFKKEKTTEEKTRRFAKEDKYSEFSHREGPYKNKYKENTKYKPRKEWHRSSEEKIAPGDKQSFYGKNKSEQFDRKNNVYSKTNRNSEKSRQTFSSEGSSNVDRKIKYRENKPLKSIVKSKISKKSSAPDSYKKSPTNKSKSSNLSMSAHPLKQKRGR